MDRTEYEQEKAGVAQPDAEVEEEVTEEVEEVEEETDESEIEEENDEDELPDLPEDQKNAFQKRLEREQNKIRKSTEEELKQQYEQKYGKHKQIVDMLGGDPDRVQEAIRENQMRAEAQKLAQQNNWNNDQTEWYVQQQKKDDKLRDLEVQVEINELKGKSEYAGIEKMKEEIKHAVRESNGYLTVEKAYWAVGGPSRANQIKRETEQRNIAKRKKTKRTVQSDSPTSTAGKQPLTPDLERQRQRMGLSETEARELWENDTPSNLEDFRKMKK